VKRDPETGKNWRDVTLMSKLEYIYGELHGIRPTANQYERTKLMDDPRIKTNLESSSEDDH
jgi:hypothetical protein